MFDAYPGETIRISAVNLTKLGLPVTEDADVDITITDRLGVVVASGTAINDVGENDWYYDFTAPATTGQYDVKFIVDVLGTVRKRKTTLTVRQL